MMGVYLNPGKELFRRSVNTDIFIDKSMLIDYTNKVINTNDMHICVSRPRRFGKSMAANMLVAYYSRGCDSRELFKGLKIAQTDDFDKHINKYNVIHLNIQDFAEQSKNATEMTGFITADLLDELTHAFSDIELPSRVTLEKVLTLIYNEYGIPFVFIIDEWDCVFRKFLNDTDGHKAYLNLLRILFKDKPYMALNYATGILPVKKYGEHSALNMYAEYSMANQAMLAEFTGFTSEDVAGLCSKYNLPSDKMSEWYDGYKAGHFEIYNPQSVVRATSTGIFDNYWTKTETFEALQMYIKLDIDDLRKKVVRMIAGEKISVNTSKFQNDMVSLNSSDDVLTLLIHLGYLTYDFDTKQAWIPNKEVGQEFINCIEDGGWEEVMFAIRQSNELLEATLAENSERVAEIIEEVHQKNTSIIAYSNEQSLASILSLAYYSARSKYEVFRELHGGKGFADLTFIPRRNVDSPAMVIELKYNKSASDALQQIEDRNYSEKLGAFSGEILLVGISYDDNKGHTCEIKRITKI